MIAWNNIQVYFKDQFILDLVHSFYSDYSRQVVRWVFSEYNDQEKLEAFLFSFQEFFHIEKNVRLFYLILKDTFVPCEKACHTLNVKSLILSEGVYTPIWWILQSFCEMNRALAIARESVAQLENAANNSYWSFVTILQDLPTYLIKQLNQAK